MKCDLTPKLLFLLFVTHVQKPWEASENLFSSGVWPKFFFSPVLMNCSLVWVKKSFALIIFLGSFILFSICENVFKKNHLWNQVKKRIRLKKNFCAWNQVKKIWGILSCFQEFVFVIIIVTKRGWKKQITLFHTYIFSFLIKLLLQMEKS